MRGVVFSGVKGGFFFLINWCEGWCCYGQKTELLTLGVWVSSQA